MELDYYSAEHVCRFALPEPVKVTDEDGRDHEVCAIRIDIDWANAEVGDGGPEGWWITGRLLGWPLTAKGARDKRTKVIERVWAHKYPSALWPAVEEAWRLALVRTGIDSDAAPILNPDTGLFDPAKWEDEGTRLPKLAALMAEPAPWEES